MDNNIFTIDKVTLTTTSVKITWKDKQLSHFHFLWLRDNCPSSFHPDTKMRKFNILDVSDNIHPTNLSINEDGNLQIKRSENNHKSIFSNSWLRNNCYTIKNKRKFRDKKIVMSFYQFERFSNRSKKIRERIFIWKIHNNVAIFFTHSFHFF